MMTSEQMYNEWRIGVMLARTPSHSRMPPNWYELPEPEKQAWDRLQRKASGTFTNNRALDREIPDQREAHARLAIKYAQEEAKQS